MLLRKRGMVSSILAVALLVAILASTNSIVNYIDLQVQTLGGLVNLSRTYLILGGNATSITDSQVDARLARKLSNLSCVGYMLPQKMLTVNLTSGSSNLMVQMRGVESDAFFKARKAYMNGTAAKNWMEANVGEILARRFSIGLGDEVSLSFGGRQAKVRVVGVFVSQTQSDAELVVPMETANVLDGNNNTVSFIEFSLKDGVSVQEAVNRIVQTLPENVKLVQAQQMGEFAQQMSIQTLVFLNVWSLAVYAAIAAASYVVAARLIIESSYELAMLKALGAKKLTPFTLVFTYTTTVAFIGSILGTALGTVGAQTASTILRWIQPDVDMVPFLKAEQALQTLLLTLASSILGCMHPALKSTRTGHMGQPL